MIINKIPGADKLMDVLSFPLYWCAKTVLPTPQNAWIFRLIVEPSIATDLPIRFRYIRPQVNSISDTIQYWYFSYNTDFALVMEKILRELMLQIQLWK